MNKSLLSLACCGFGLGMTEFSMMGLLPNIANSLQVTIPEAGHFISAYALGVCVGAPALVILTRKQPPKTIILILMLIFTVFNLLSAFSPNYSLMLFARFMAGLPHGAFFGVGAIVATQIAQPGRRNQAIAIMFAGLTFANLAGIPLGAYVGSLFSWRITYTFIGLWGLLSFVAIFLYIPNIVPASQGSLASQFRFLNHPIPWVIFFITLFANGGFFAWYSYIKPLLTEVSGYNGEGVSYILIIAGLGMFMGSLLGGKISDKIRPIKATLILLFCFILCLVSNFFLSTSPQVIIVVIFLTTLFLMSFAPALQGLLILHSAEGQMLGAAMCQVAFNLGNAIGAYAGGLPIDAGYSYLYPALVGSAMAVVALLLCFGYQKRI